MKTLVAGIGNIFMGDDAFGCEVASRLSQCDLPDDVDVVDFGIRGMDLGYTLMDGYELAILIDTADQGGEPGTVYVIEPDFDESEVAVVETGEQIIAPHEMDPAKVLRFVATLGEQRPRVLLVACQPEYMGGEHGHMGLSDPVAAAIDEAVAEVREILAQRSSGNHAHPPTEDGCANNQHRSEVAPGGVT